MSKKTFMLPALLAMYSLLGSTYASENNKPEQVKINKSISNNKSELPPSNSLNINRAIAFTLGTGIGIAGGYLGTKKFVVDPLDEENQKLKNENNTLKNKKDYKEDYDKKCIECTALSEDMSNLVVKYNKLIEENEKLKGDLNEDNPVILKNEISNLKEKLKVFTDVWGDPEDNNKIEKMKNLYNWRYGKEGNGTYDYYINDCVKHVNDFLPNDISDEVKNLALAATCYCKYNNGFGNWAENNTQKYENNVNGFRGYFRALKELCDRQEMMKDTLSKT